MRHARYMQALTKTLPTLTDWLSLKEAVMKGSLSYSHSLFRAGVAAHERGRWSPRPLTPLLPSQQLHVHSHEHFYTLSLNRISVIHLHPWGAAKADRDICILNSPQQHHPHTPFHRQLGPPGPGQRQDRNSLSDMQSHMRTHTHTQSYRPYRINLTPVLNKARIYSN